jgi:hypothetical protein
MAAALNRTSANFRALRAGWFMDLTAWIGLASLAPLSLVVAHNPALVVLLIPPSIAYSLLMKRVNDLVDHRIPVN